MKRVFAVLSLCLGFSVAFGLDGTIYIKSEVTHPQTRETITVDFGTYTFDVFKDRRELVREIYGICQNPPEKMKTFIANRRNLGDNEIWISFHTKKTPIIGCKYYEGKLVLGENLDDIVNDIIRDNDFGWKFALFIDSARAEAKAKDINVSTPNKSITIKFGTRVINPETGAEGISTYPDFDYEFNVYDDRRELWKKVWDTCAIQLRGTILNEIKNGNKNPTISVWYAHPQGGLAELYSLKCRFDRDNGTYDAGRWSDFDEYKNGQISAEKVSKELIEDWANLQATVNNAFKYRHNSTAFNKDFMTLIDMANAGTKQSTQKSNPKKKK